LHALHQRMQRLCNLHSVAYASYSEERHVPIDVKLMRQKD
jgi:hypothetical protein